MKRYKRITEGAAQVKAYIEKTKQALIAKAKKKGIYENFGQAELRTMEENLMDQMYSDTQVKKLVQGFSDWIENFDLSQLNK